MMGRYRLLDMSAHVLARTLLWTAPPDRLLASAWRAARRAGALAAPRSDRSRRGDLARVIFQKVVERITAAGAIFEVRYSSPQPLFDYWDRHGSVIIVASHTMLSGMPLVRAIHDAGRDCTAIVTGATLRRRVLGTVESYIHTPAGPLALVRARRAVRQRKAVIILMDTPSSTANLSEDRVAAIGDRRIHLYGNIFRFAMRLAVPIVFFADSLQEDGSVALTFEAPRTVVPTSEHDVQTCLDDYEAFLRTRIRTEQR